MNMNLDDDLTLDFFNSDLQYKEPVFRSDNKIKDFVDKNIYVLSSIIKEIEKNESEILTLLYQPINNAYTMPILDRQVKDRRERINEQMNKLEDIIYENGITDLEVVNTQSLLLKEPHLILKEYIKSRIEKNTSSKNAYDVYGKNVQKEANELIELFNDNLANIVISNNNNVENDVDNSSATINFTLISK
ncbi:hypothetical protein K502DRAFT_330941 [Neoconidiobolus thromboides FSU 785]|nr:hypothetical protein K502DRAFT_330941 [Neoconidiobolus thromboides FSU 785]